ncbi:MAG: ABC transporter permease [Bacillota bacterium]
MKTIINIVIKEFLQIRRDKRLFAIVFMAPVLQLLFLGYAATMDVNTVHTAVIDQDKTVSSREFIRNFERSGYFSIDYYLENYEKATDLIDKGKVLVTIIIPKDFEKKINRSETVKLQTIFDGSDGNKTSIALGYVTSITSSYSKNILLDSKDRSGMKGSISGTLNPEVRVWYNPDLKTRNFMIPSIMGLVLMVITTILMSMAIVKEREIGTLEQLIVTPIKPYQLILGKIVPFIIIGFLEVLLVTSIMILWFNIPVRGNYFFLIFSSLLFVMSTLGIGLFISTISKTQQQAMMVAQFGIMMPMIYLSGFAFPIENMPQIIQYLTYMIPLRYYITILRGIILKGVGFTDLWVELLALFATGVIILFASSLRFKKRLE